MHTARRFLTYVLLQEAFVTALDDVVAEAVVRDQVASVEGAGGQLLGHLGVALHKATPKPLPQLHISPLHS